MIRLLDKLPLILALIMVLLFGNASGAVWPKKAQSTSKGIAHLDNITAGDAAVFQSHLVISRALRFEAYSLRKKPHSWPEILVSFASLLALFCFLLWVRRHYLSATRHCLFDDDANLQYRFIHSR